MSLLRRILSGIGRALVWLALGLLTLWSCFAIRYSNLPGWLCLPAAILFAALVLVVRLRVKPPRRARLSLAALFAVLIGWWLLIPPRNDRDWTPDLVVLPWAEIEGNTIKLHENRNCQYTSETDYKLEHYDKTLQLDQLQTADFTMVYWGSPTIAHTMMSFGFADGSFVCFSIETRKERGEEYSAIKGFFKQYELTYVVADERDVIKLRTDFRKEDVYLYRLKAPVETLREVFVDYLREVNRLKDSPEWYNAATSNCTTQIRGHTEPYNPNHSWDWRMLINGRLDELIYERGAVDTSLPFAELKQRSHINAKALAAGDSADFSRLIRVGIPGIAR